MYLASIAILRRWLDHLDPSEMECSLGFWRLLKWRSSWLCPLSSVSNLPGVRRRLPCLAYGHCFELQMVRCRGTGTFRYDVYNVYNSSLLYYLYYICSCLIYVYPVHNYRLVYWLDSFYTYICIYMCFWSWVYSSLIMFVKSIWIEYDWIEFLDASVSLQGSSTKDWASWEGKDLAPKMHDIVKSQSPVKR